MKEAGELRENLEVYCDPHHFPWEVILTPSQKGKKRQELEREKEEEVKERKEEFEVHRNPRFRRSISLVLSRMEGRRKGFGREQKEKEAREHKEKPEVSRDPRPYRHSTTLIPWQREKRREELERGKKDKEAEEAATKAKETLEEKVLKSVQTKPRPTTPGYSSDGGGDDKNTPPVAGSSGWVNVDELSHPSTFSPAETGRSPGRLDSDKTTAGDRYHQGGQSRNPFSAFFVRLYFGG